MLNSRLPNSTILNNSTTLLYNLATTFFNTSQHDECLHIDFSLMEFLPWDNPGNIISQNVETISRIIKNNVLLIFFLIGGPGNVINMAVFYKQGIRDRVNLCLFALSLADELFLTTSMLLHGEQLYLQFKTKETFGPINTLLTNNHIMGLVGFGYVSHVLSAIIASERCYCVLNPLKSQTVLRTRTMAATIGFVTVVVVGLFYITSFRYHIGCVYDPVSGVVMKTGVPGKFYQDHQQFIEFLDISVFGAGLPGCVMSVVLVTTIITVLKLRQIVTWRAGISSSISSREVALTKMLVATSVLFIVCAFPVATTPIVWFLFPEINAGRRNQNLYLTTIWLCEILAYINTSVNIFVYYVMGSRYRQTLKSLFTRSKRAEQVNAALQHVSVSTH